MPRKKNDGRGKTGGRKQGTPNREKPLKTFLREHSLSYFIPTISRDIAIQQHPDHLDTLSQFPPDATFSQYDLDLLDMRPSDRVNAELALLNYHTPKMQSTSVDMSLSDKNQSLIDRLSLLATGHDIPSQPS